jgi:hypothetical protein
MREEEKYKEVKNDQLMTDENGKKFSSEEFNKRRFKQDKQVENFKKQFKNLDEMFINSDIKVPEIIYLSNKCENGFEGDMLSDFY